MPVEEGIKAVHERKNILVGILMDTNSRELLNWALVKVAEPGDSVVAIHVSQTSSDHDSKTKPMLDGYLEGYEGLCSLKKVDLTGEVCTGKSVRKILVREAINYDAFALVVGTSKQSVLRIRASKARYCAKQLPQTTNILAIYKGTVLFKRFSNNQLSGLRNRDPKPSFTLPEKSSLKECQSEFGDSETGTEASCFENSQKDASEHRPGWPLLRVACSSSPKASHRRSVSVVQWVMSLPNRSPLQSPRNSTIEESPFSRMNSFDNLSDTSTSFEMDKQHKYLDSLLKKNLSSCKWFAYDVLRAATSHFSPENMIGKGGCNSVYKGILPSGKPVAVKILKSSKGAWEDFANEVDIISSVENKYITPLLGICINNNDLLSVYEFLFEGNLEENLHGKSEEKHVLPWDVRFNIAVGVAEALDYLHNRCSQPVIHRDVKSSNILLSYGYEPQLTDFGIAVWGPTTSSFLTRSNIVGTFGYLAPEYFMYGKVSDKIDVYAFGVVLLELLSGKKPICSEAPKGVESLVTWAKPMLKSGDVEGILDPCLEKNFDEVQMQRMVFAAVLCLTQAARIRPKMSEILKILRGDNDMNMWTYSQYDHGEKHDDEDNEDDDEVYPSSCRESHLNLAFLDVLDDDDDNFTSFSSSDQSTNLSWEDYLKGRWSRSSSFN